MKKLGLLLGAAAGIAGQAGAQTTPGDPAGTPPPAAAAQAAAPDDSATAGIADIIVTAQRRSENLQRAAVAVTAVNGAQLAAADVTDVNNLTRLVPSLVVQPQGGASTNFYIRGVGTFGTNAFSENAVAFNFAGVYIARPTSPLGTLFDLERVEVVKGPQGTLYGRNATGGAINVIPNRPVLDAYHVDLSAEYGNYDTKKVAGAVNIPLGPIIALRLAGQVVDRGAYLSDGYDNEVGQAARATLLIKPSSDFSMTLIGDYFHQGGKGVGSVLIPGATAPTAPPIEDRIAGSDPRSLAELKLRFPFQINSGLITGPKSDGFLHSNYYGVTMVNEANLGFATLIVTPAYRRSEPDFLSYTNGFTARVTEKDDQGSLEIRLASNGSGRLGYVLGAYYFYERQDAANLFSHGPISTTIVTPRLTTESKAVFAQASYKLTDTFRLVAGGRYTQENKGLQGQLRSLTPTAPNPPPTNLTGTLGFDRFTWKAGAEFDAGPRSLLYANVATGFKAGGFYIAAVDNTYRPEKLTAYTLGSKNRFLDNRLQLNAELFYWKYQDQQVSFVGPAQYAPGVYNAGGITVNAGDARMYGADVDVVFEPTPADRFAVNAQYLDSKYTRFLYNAFSATGAPGRSGCVVSPSTSSTPVNAPAKLFAVNCAGKPALNAPRLSMNLSYEHIFTLSDDLSLVPSANVRVESSRYLALDYLPEELQRAYTLADLALALNGGHNRWSLTGYVNNVTNKTVLASATQRAFLPLVYGALRPPRTYGVRVAFHY